MAETLSVAVDLQELAAVYDWADQAAQRLNLPRACRVVLQIVVEEAVSNVMRHGFPDAPPAPGDRINLALDDDVAWVTLSLDDNGIPFDPCSVPTPERAATLEDVTLGGQGIPMIRRRTAAMHYERRDGRNRLALRIAHVPAKPTAAVV